jgi:hypothetical protein
MSGSGWVSVRCLFETTWAAGRSYEERITLWLTADLQHGIELAEAEAQQYASGLTTPEVSTTYVGLAQAYALLDEPGQSREVFSLIRDSDLAPEAYIRAHFDTGREHTSTSPRSGPQKAPATGATDAVSSPFATWWSLDRTSTQEKIFQLVSSLRPPAHAYRGRGGPISLGLPVTTTQRFVSEQVVHDLLGAVPGPVDVLPAGSRWHYALDVDQLDRAGEGVGRPSRVHLYGTPPGVEVSELVIGEVVSRGAAQITVDFDATAQPLKLGPDYDVARGDALGLLVNGQPTQVALVDAAETVMWSQVRLGGRPARLGMSCCSSPAIVLNSLLWADGLR